MVNQRNPKNFIRADKTTKNQDDYKVLIVGAVIAVMILIFQFTSFMVREERWYRDMMGLTPFHSIVVTSQTVDEEEQSITVTGVMVKHRCEFKSLQGYIITETSRHRVFVNTRPEDILTGVVGSRPPSNKLETWGPWLITFAVLPQFADQMPIGYEIWSDHECPEDPASQNLFAAGSWETLVLQEDGFGGQVLSPPVIRNRK